MARPPTLICYHVRERLRPFDLNNVLTVLRKKPVYAYVCILSESTHVSMGRVSRDC